MESEYAVDDRSLTCAAGLCLGWLALRSGLLRRVTFGLSPDVVRAPLVLAMLIEAVLLWRTLVEDLWSSSDTLWFTLGGVYLWTAVWMLRTGRLKVTEERSNPVA